MKDILLVTVWVVYCITAHQFIIQMLRLIINLNIVAENKASYLAKLGKIYINPCNHSEQQVAAGVCQYVKAKAASIQS